MSKSHEATRHNNSAKLLIFLPLRANLKSTFLYETPCRNNLYKLDPLTPQDVQQGHILIVQFLVRNFTHDFLNYLFSFFSFFRYSNRRTISSSDRTLINAFRTISGMCDRINLPRTITDRANALFKKVHDGKNLRGRSNDAISSGRIYLKLQNLVKSHHQL